MKTVTDYYVELSKLHMQCLNLKGEFGQRKGEILNSSLGRGLKKDFESSTEELEAFYDIEILMDDSLSRVDYIFFKNETFVKQVSVFTFDRNNLKRIKNFLFSKTTCLSDVLTNSNIILSYDSISVLSSIKIEIDGL